MDAILYWLATRARARTYLLSATQPRTVSQLARDLQIDRDACGYLLRTLLRRGLVQCLNARARRSRIYGLTRTGRAVQRVLRQRQHLPAIRHPQGVDWHLYGQVCFRHRTAVLLALDRPMRAAGIKRRARYRDPELRINTNNVRDVLRFLRVHGLVCRVERRGQCYPDYDLTERGRAFQALLQTASARP